MTTLKALGTYILVKPTEANPVSEGGLFIPPSVTSTGPQEGTVASVGANVKISVSEGSKVLFDKRGVMEQKTLDGTLHIVPEINLFAVWV